MKIAFYGEGAELLEARDFVVPAKESVTVIFEEAKKLKGILLNYEDEAFIKVRIDRHSIEFFKKNLKNVQDELSRTLIWKAFWDMLRDGLISSLEFIDIVTKSLAEENSDVILNDVLVYTRNVISEFTPLKLRSLLNYKVFDLIYHLLLKTDPQNTNRVVSLRENLIEFVDDETHVDLILEWFKGNVPALSKYSLGLSEKWKAVKLAYSLKKLDSDTRNEFYAKVQQEDPSEQSVKVKKTVEALILRPDQRNAIWQSYLKQSKDSIDVTIASMRGFNSIHHLKDLQAYHEAFFDVILEVVRTESKEHSSVFYDMLYPNGDDLDYYIKKTTALIKEVDEKKEGWFLPPLRRTVDDLRRRQRTYVTVEKYLKNELF